MKCFGSERWAAAMADARPFNLVEQVFETAESTWASLPAGEWLEALECEEDISSATNGDHGNKERISELYKQKFGFPLISYSDGRSPEEMLTEWRSRFNNSTQTEMRTAANDLRKIALQKLNTLLEQELAHADNTA